MKIKTGRFTGKKWLVNNKNKRITKKYDDMTLQEIGLFTMFCGIKDNKTAISVIILKENEIARWNGIISIIPITDNLFVLTYNEKYYVYNINGDLLRDDFNYVWNCKNYSMMQVKIGKQTYFMDYNLNILSVPFAQTTAFDIYGHAIVKLWETPKWAVINKDLEFILGPMEYDGVLFCSATQFRVIKAGKYGVVDIMGKEIIPPIYDDVIYIKGYFKLCLNGKYGLADSNGNIVYECVYSDIIAKRRDSTMQQNDES